MLRGSVIRIKRCSSSVFKRVAGPTQMVMLRAIVHRLIDANGVTSSV